MSLFLTKCLLEDLLYLRMDNNYLKTRECLEYKFI